MTGFVLECIASASFNVGGNMFALRIVRRPLDEALFALKLTSLINQIVTSINLGQLSRKQSKHGRTPISYVHTGFEGRFAPLKGLVGNFRNVDNGLRRHALKDFRRRCMNLRKIQ